jgi:hypothetical protein
MPEELDPSRDADRVSSSAPQRRDAFKGAALRDDLPARHAFRAAIAVALLVYVVTAVAAVTAIDVDATVTTAWLLLGWGPVGVLFCLLWGVALVSTRWGRFAPYWAAPMSVVVFVAAVWAFEEVLPIERPPPGVELCLPRAR